MKKITKQRAIELINLGIYPLCEVSRDVKRSVTSLTELQNLESLSGVQSFILWSYEDSEIESFKIPENALSVTVDEATNIILANDSADCICLKVIGKEERIFSGINQLKEFLELHKKCEFLKIPFLLYWKNE